MFVKLVIYSCQPSSHLIKSMVGLLEVDPQLAYDTSATVERGLYLAGLVNRPNLLIKVPATMEGLPAIEELTAQGISVNVTLIFSVERYQLVMDAYLRGLERRLEG
jgi:transaldolase